MDKPNPKHDSLVVFEAGTLIFIQGDRTENAYLIKEGLVELFYQTVDNVILAVETVGIGSLIGVTAAYRETPLMHSARTKTKTAAWPVSCQLLNRMLGQEGDAGEPVPDSENEDWEIIEYSQKFGFMHQNLAQELMTEQWFIQRTLMELDRHNANLNKKNEVLIEKNIRRLSNECARLKKEVAELRKMVTTQPDQCDDTTESCEHAEEVREEKTDPFCTLLDPTGENKK